jgi:adenine-specific DNA-methyltransferase
MNNLDFGKRLNGKQHGVVLTKPVVVMAILDLVEYFPSRNLNGIRIVEPSAGEGAFAIEILRRLHQSSVGFGFDFGEAIQQVHFYEIDENSILKLQSNIEGLFTELEYDGQFYNIHHEDYLSSELRSIDIVVGNPPYVRYDNIPEAVREKYKSLYATFRFRCDLYILFYEKCLSQLKNSGRLAFICSNRWLKSQYGRPLRQLISRKYHLEMIIDLTETQPFQEEVLAYPAITILSYPQGNTSCEWHRVTELEALAEIAERKHSPDFLLAIEFGSDEWFGQSLSPEFEVKCNLELIEKQGFKIGIGVATGCDKVFIGIHLKESIEEELLLPIISGKDLRGDVFSWRGEFLLNPYDSHGNLIQLGPHPKARKYLMGFEDILRQRHVSKKNPDSWYRTIDKVQKSLVKQPKILLPDISGNRTVFIDNGEYYPNHNIYYITGSGIGDLKVLAALLMSAFVREQLENVGNKMNGGYPRWQSQNLRKLRIPLIKAISDEYRTALIKAYDSQDHIGINSVVALIITSISSSVLITGQLELFHA